MERQTIRVTGHGELRVQPDTVRMTLTLAQTDEAYDRAVAAAEDAAARVSEALAKAGISELRACGLRTEPKYETVTDESGRRTQKFAGYCAVRRIRASFAAEADLLGKALSALAASGAAPEISVEYTLARPEALREELLARAVKDAKSRAKAIAKAADIKLKGIVTLENAGHGMPFVRAAALRMDGGADLAPEDMTFTEDVIAVYEIG